MQHAFDLHKKIKIQHNYNIFFFVNFLNVF
jgi:hypothetical protein